MSHILVHDTGMPHVSQQKLDKEVEDKVVSLFQLVFSNVNQVEDMQPFILTLMAPTEQLMLAKRLMVFFLLREGYSDCEISRLLHMTRFTISRLKYFMESHGEGLAVVWKVLETEKLKSQLGRLLLHVGAYAARAAGGRVKATIL